MRSLITVRAVETSANLAKDSDQHAHAASGSSLVGFAARYYQRALGEVALAALPPQLRDLDTTQLARRLQRKPAAATTHSAPGTAPVLTEQQHAVLLAAGREQRARREQRGSAPPLSG